MTLYSSNFYDQFKYGREALVTFNASPFTARPIDYGKIRLSWSKPQGDWDVFRLLRNPFGFPMTADDGDVLLEVDTTYTEQTIVDTGAVPGNTGLVQGRTYYYSIFVRQTSDKKWFNAGITTGLSVKDYGTATLMYEYLPFIYKTMDIMSVTDNEGKPNTELYSFLRMFAFEYDVFKTMTENAKNRYDILNLDGRLIPTVLHQFGLSYERELGVQQGRRMLQNYSSIYGKKGSAAGLKTFVSAFTGYNCSLGSAKNLMLNVDDSSFELGVGSWYAPASATLAAITGASESPTVSPYSESTSPSNFPNLQQGILKVTPSASTDITMYCGSISDVTKSVTQGIPVIAGTAYAFSIYSRAKTTAKNIKTGIKWVTRTGALSSTTVTEVTSTNQSTSAWNRTTVVTATAPADAVWAIPYVTIVSAASGEVHYFDAAQFEVGSSSTDFVDARRIDVYLLPNRVNEIINPSFETVTTNWTVSGGTGATSATAPNGVGGTNSLKITASSSAPTLVGGFYMSAAALDSHAFSAYVKGPATDKVKLTIKWYDSAYSQIGAAVSSSDFALKTTWDRVSYVATSPANTVWAKVELVYTSTSGNEVFADALLFEKGSYLQPYFDGGHGYQETSDLRWETVGSTANDAVNGRSLYYRNLTVTYKRLKAVMGDFVPNYAPWATFIAQIV